ncbi:hypothetical protein AFL94_02565 [Arthrobacter sp. LS16]|nr:hypothetical protein AFL94_02565 [Arthrobacter sp. LS16]
MLNPLFHHDDALVDEIAARFGLRRHNQEALHVLVETLSGNFESAVPQVLNMATGAGKTYLMAAFVEYLRMMGIRNVMVITPSLVVQNKTVQNFTFGSSKFIAGADRATAVVTPDDYSEWTHTDHEQDFFGGGIEDLQLFVFNIQQLLAPADLDGSTSSDKASNAPRRFRRYIETHGMLLEYLESADDLVVIADEHHLYGPSAKAFRQAIVDLKPAAVVGLTASASKDDQVIYSYPLYRAIREGHVKQPVIAYRKNVDYTTVSDEQQLRDALVLLDAKQAAFDAYIAATPKTKPLNAVLFVICTDVESATLTADLLRTPEFFGVYEQVLQVDNKHNDVGTMARLDALDHPGSPVRAVVSVNKLREGWDVKNIAVMLAQRAMASDVLTQQTMGRGLRLPFGKLTGIATIDQLDILSHRSFSRLVKSEEILRTFGLENASSRPEDLPTPANENGSDTEGEVPKGAADDGQPTTSGPENPANPQKPADEPADDDEISEWDLGGVRVRGYNEGEVDKKAAPEVIEVKVQDKFAGTFFVFPSSMISMEQREFALHSIGIQEIEDAGRQITDAGAVLEREEIVVRKMRQGLKLDSKATDQASVKGISIDRAEVEAALLKTLFSMKFVARTPENVTRAKKATIPMLLNAAPVKDWTAEAAASAGMALVGLTKRAAAAHSQSLNPVLTIVPTTIPENEKYVLPSGEKIAEQVSSVREFDTRKHYGDWSRSLFTAAKFDSYSAEYKLAELLNKSPDIVWWKKLYFSDGASVAYHGGNYYPDFVALDTEGVYWILEGKAESGRTDSTVQAKKAATEQLLSRIISEDEFEGARWAYLVAYEDTVAQVQSWAQLRESSGSVKIPPLI